MSFELLERDLPIVVLVDLLDDFGPDLLSFLVGGCAAATEYLFQLVGTDRAVIVDVEDRESFLKVIVTDELLLIEGRGEELIVADFPILVEICRTEKFFDIGLIKIEKARYILHVRLDLFHVEISIVVFVPFLEHFS